MFLDPAQEELCPQEVKEPHRKTILRDQLPVINQNMQLREFHADDLIGADILDKSAECLELFHLSLLVDVRGGQSIIGNLDLFNQQCFPYRLLQADDVIRFVDGFTVLANCQEDIFQDKHIISIY